MCLAIPAQISKNKVWTRCHIITLFRTNLIKKLSGGYCCCSVQYFLMTL